MGQRQCDPLSLTSCWSSWNFLNFSMRSNACILSSYVSMYDEYMGKYEEYSVKVSPTSRV